ncbi:MAG: MATE family efflux transporter [Clostridiales bacterium]|nr:MATE family efflux transporter [Clostridiales bacterium]
MATNRVTTDLTKGNPLKMTVRFAIPIFLSNILQQIYVLTDVAIIGHTLGDDALSAIGTVTTIYGFFNSLMFGMASGFSVVISRFFGSKDEKGLKRAIANTLFISAIWGILVPLAGLLSLKKLMTVLDTPAEIFDMAYSYASVVISLLSFVFIYNVLRSVLQAIGNSRAPLYFLMISVTTNILLDLLFVRQLGFGLPGAAYATGIAQALSSVITFIYIVKFVPQVHLSRKDMVLDKTLLVEIFSSGLAFALMFTVVNLGSMILQHAINNLGKTIIAAHVAARKISELCMMTLSTLANAMATFAGQNHGARRYDRIKQGHRSVMLFAFGIAAVLIFMVYMFGDEMVVLISGTSNPELISNAVFYLRFDLPFYFVLAVLLITRTTLQGMGAKFVPVIASVMELLLKVVTAKWLAARLGYLGIAICEPVIWIVCAVFIIIVFRMQLKKNEAALQT